MPRHHTWTNKEVERLKIAFPITPGADLVQMFAPHSYHSIKWMAGKLKLRKRKNWEEYARNHAPVFRLPLPPVPKPERPWS